MTPDQDLKAALIGEAQAPKRGKSARVPRRARRDRPRRSAWPFRWGIKFLMMALMLMISRGLMQAPEVQAMWAEAKVKLIGFIEEERAARAAVAASETLESVEATEVTSTDSRMPENKVAVRRMNTAPAVRVLEGAVNDVLSGNALLISGVPVVIDGLVCAAPDSERGAAEAAALASLTQGQTLRCTVTGEAGTAAVTAHCTMKGGRDLAGAMLADRVCQPG